MQLRALWVLKKLSSLQVTSLSPSIINLANTKRLVYGYNRPHKIPAFVKANHSSIHQVACGFGFTLFACSSKGRGMLYGCGLNSDGQLGPQPDCLNTTATTSSNSSPLKISVLPSPTLIDLPLTGDELSDYKITHLGCGRLHSVVALHVKQTGQASSPPILLAMGNNAFGQCGRQIISNELFDSESGAITRLVLSEDVRSIKQVCCGQDHTLLLTSDGRVYSTGLGVDGQTGLGHFDAVDSFHQVAPDLFTSSNPVEQLACRGDTVLALTRSGRLYGWGNNEYGQIWPTDVEHLTQIARPVELPLGNCDDPSQHVTLPSEANPDGRPSRRPFGPIVSLACAGSMCGAVDASGQVAVWGFGCLGLGPVTRTVLNRRPTLIPPNLFSPDVQSSTSPRVVRLVAGLHHFLAIGKDGLALWAWGAPRGGLYCLGLGHSTPSDDGVGQSYPLPVALSAAVDQVACGVDHTVVLTRSLA